MRQLFYPGDNKKLAISIANVYNILVMRLICEHENTFKKNLKKVLT